MGRQIFSMFECLGSTHTRWTSPSYKQMCIRDRQYAWETVCYVIWGKASAKSGQKVVETAPEELKERYRQIFIPVTENMEQRGGLL